MARGRMINKNLVKSRKFNSLKDDNARLLYCLMLAFADRDGRLEGDTDLVKATIYPRRTDVTISMVDKWLQMLQSSGLIEWYEVDRDKYIQICKFAKGQEGMRYDREQKSRIPQSSDITPAVAGSTPREVEVEYKEEIEEGGSAHKRFTPPTIQEIHEYGCAFCQEKGFPKFKRAEAESIFDHYKSNGWKVGGKSPMKDWKSAVRNCIRRDAPESTISPKEIEKKGRRLEKEFQEIEAENSGVEFPSVMEGIITTKATKEFMEAEKCKS